MKKFAIVLILVSWFLAAKAGALESVKLPAAVITGGNGLNQIIQTRRSIREYKEAPITISDVSQLLWAAQGITEPKAGHRAAPSAVATYPLKVYAMVKEGGVTGLPAGVYLYEPKDHSLTVVKKGNPYSELLKTMDFFNNWVKDTDVVFIFTGKSSMIEKVQKESGMLFTDLEGGMASENLVLESVSLGLGRCTIGGFSDKKAAALMGLDSSLRILLMVPVGQPK